MICSSSRRRYCAQRSWTLQAVVAPRRVRPLPPTYAIALGANRRRVTGSASADEDDEEERWRRLAASNCNDKYRGKFSSIRDDELSTSIEQSVAAVENTSDPEEERWLKYAAMCGNKVASKALGTQELRGVRAWDAFQRDESHDEIMTCRVEGELLRKVKQTLAGQLEPRSSPKDVPCPRMATARKSSKAGRAPASTRGAHEAKFIAEQEAAVRAKLRQKLEKGP
jgi:hypothetical protein